MVSFAIYPEEIEYRKRRGCQTNIVRTAGSRVDAAVVVVRKVRKSRTDGWQLEEQSVFVCTLSQGVQPSYVPAGRRGYTHAIMRPWRCWS